MQVQLSAKTQTLLKQYPKDSKSGKAGEMYDFGPSDKPLDIEEYSQSDGQHLCLTLGGESASRLGSPHPQLYVWLPHIEIVETGHPDPQEATPITNLERDKNDRGEQIQSPIGLVYLNDPVHPQAPSFKVYELTRNGERVPPTTEMWQQLQAIALAMQPHRDRLGEPCVITSGYRPADINRAVGGVPDSRHTTHADAIDFYFPSMTKQAMWDYFHPLWPGGLGMYGHDALHADCRSYHARWGTEWY